MNKEWHAANVLGKGANQSQRIAWHRAHQKQCACRPIPKSLLGLVVPSPEAPSPSSQSKRQRASNKKPPSRS